MTKNKKLCDKFDLGSVQSLFTGAAPLGMETAMTLQEQYPSWYIRQGYGMLCSIHVLCAPLNSLTGLTETCTVVCSTSYNDIDLGSSGYFLPAVEAKIVSIEGNEITGYDQPGELVIRAPSVVLGYLNNDAANKETFQDGWMRTGDEALIRKSPKGNEHVWIVDRIKELIKVKVWIYSKQRLSNHAYSGYRACKWHQPN